MAGQHDGVYFEQGADKIIVAAAGQITLESGGVIDGSAATGAFVFAAGEIVAADLGASAVETAKINASAVTAAKTVAPRQPTHDLIGVASLYAAAGEGVEVPVVVGNDRVKIVVASGGDTKTGTFHVIVG